VFTQIAGHCLQRSPCGSVRGESVCTGADRGKRQVARADTGPQIEAPPVAAAQKLLFAIVVTCQVCPTAWITQGAGRACPAVTFVFPGSQPPSVLHSNNSPGPAGR
jgi:hypothetical protein